MHQGQLLFIVSLCRALSSVQGLRQSAVSLSIPSNVPVKSTGWYKIQNWQAPVDSGHLITGTTLSGVNNSDVYIPRSGLYTVFITLSLTGADVNGRFKLALVINNNINNSPNGMSSSVKGGPLGPKSLTINGVVHLQHADHISVYVYSETDSDWTISGQSKTTLSMEFVDSLEEVPGFSASLKSPVVVTTSGWRYLREWSIDSRPGLFKSQTGFSKHVGEFVPICDGVYLVSANVRIQTNTSSPTYFQLGIAINSDANGSTVKAMSSDEFTLSASVSLHFRKGQIVSLLVKGSALTPWTVSSDSGFSAVRLSSYSSTTPGFSTVLQNSIKGSGGGWIRIPLQLPNGTSYGQFQTATKYIAAGRYNPHPEGLYTITATIRLLSDSFVQGAVFTRTNSATDFNGQIRGLYSSVTKTSSSEEVTISISGVLELLLTQPLLSFYIYMQNSGNYQILSGSRISVSLVQAKYPAFHATLNTELSQAADNAWVELSSWKTNVAQGSFSQTDRFVQSTGRYTADQSGIYHVSSNIIFNSQSEFVSLLISANGGYSKRNSLFSTKGNPANKDTLSVSGSLQLNKGDYVSVHVKSSGTSSWFVSAKSSFSLVYLGLPFSVPGFSAVLSSTKTYSTDAWHQVKGLLSGQPSHPLFYYGGGLDYADCKYTVPVSGLYVVGANLKLKRATTVGAEFTANIAIDNSPAATERLNGLNDFVERTVSLGNQDFYSLNVAGVMKLTANQNVSLWVRSKSAGTWDISEDSTFSVALLHLDNDFQASGFQAALDPSISQSVVGASTFKIVRYWVTTRSNSEKGLFNLDKYQDLGASSGSVTIREAGLYFVSATIALNDANDKFEMDVNLDPKTEGGLPGLYSLVDTSRLNKYTLKAFGILNIGASHKLSIRIQASNKRTWAQDVLYCGLSFVKIAPFVVPPTLSASILPGQSFVFEKGNWTRITNWATSLIPVQHLSGSGFSKTTGVFTVPRNGLFLVSAYVVTESIDPNPTVNLKIALNPDLSDSYTPSITNGLSTMTSKCNASCMLHSSGVMSLQKGDKLGVYIQSNYTSSLHIHNSSTFSVVLVHESKPLPNGMLAEINVQTDLMGTGSKRITGWSLMPSSGNFYSSLDPLKSLDNFHIDTTGIYFLSISMKFAKLQGLTKAFTSLLNIQAITAVHKQSIDEPFVLSVSGCMKIKSGDKYTLTVSSEEDRSYLILPGSVKSGVYLGSQADVIGFTAIQSATRTIAIEANKTFYIYSWSTVNKDWLFESGNGFRNRESFIAPKSGIYYVSAHIIIAASLGASTTRVSVGIEKGGFLRQQNGLHTSAVASGNVKTTLILAGTMYLEKWSQIKLVMRASRAISIEIDIDSTFSVVKLDKDLSSNICTDNGPRIVDHLDPEEFRTSYNKQVSWKCSATGISPTYGWMKNYAAIPGNSLQSLSISSTQVADTGEYVCTATYDGIRVSSNIAKLTVFDPIPVFSNPAEQYNVTASENGPQTLGLLDVLVRASSLGNSFAQMSFQIISGNVNDTFSLSTVNSDKGFTLMRAKPLDREAISSYSIIVQATNLEAYSVATQRININVSDVNDNAPIFSQKVYTTAIYENTTVGTTVIRVFAADRDINENAKIVYWFIPSSAKNVFAVNSNTGDVTLQESLNREIRDLYVIFVKAYDSVFAAYSELTIRILDVNEFAPVFEPQNYVINVSETVLPGSSLLSVTATDRDTGRNAELVYNITGGDPDGIFRITSHGSIQNQRRLDYETSNSFLLTVSVQDSGQPPLRANETASVRIYVGDANDNSPLFEKESYVMSVYENATIGEVIGHVSAKDVDAPGQPESRVSYEMEGLSAVPDSIFTVSASSGALILNSTLDYETQTTYRFTVLARDAGSPSLKDKAQVTINVIDVNDNRPEFTVSKFVVNVTESSQINREVYKVVAKDKDANSNAAVRYSLLSGDIGNTFTIDPIFGSVIAMKSLDHERTPQYDLVISCHDKGNPQLQCMNSLELRVNVLDENDNSPSFDQIEYSANVQEGLAVGTTILFMTISDADAGLNGLFNVSIIESSARAMFEYNQVTRALTLKGQLDYEKMAQYHFTVIAKDLGTPPLEKSAVVIIKVQNVNDNAPTFRQSIYDSQIPDMVLSNYTVYQVTASDPDKGPGGRITYEIVGGNAGGLFRIGQYTGLVDTAKDLNTSYISLFSLSIVAKDSYQPPKVSNRTVLNIHVTKTPFISLSNTKAGTTSLEATINTKGFTHLNIKTYEVLVQEYKPSNENFNMFSRLSPLKWYDVIAKPSSADAELRRYTAISVAAAKTGRKRRAVVTLDTIAVVIGTEKNCDTLIAADKICNGPLKPDKRYRLQVRGYSAKNKFPRDSHFSVPVKLGGLTPNVAEMTDFSVTDGTIGLAVAFGACTIIVIVLLGCHVHYKRKHQIIFKDHLNRAAEVTKSYSVDEASPETVKTGFGPLSDISVWPQMSMAEVSHMFQRSQAGPGEKYAQVPSAEDSGINHAYEDDDNSWKLNMSDENEESWPDNRRMQTREQPHARVLHEDIQLNASSNDGILRISDNNGSFSSLETNAETYQPPKLSESLRGIFKSEENGEEAVAVNPKNHVEMSIISEESGENEIETEFGFEVETNLGPDVDEWSSDEDL